MEGPELSPEETAFFAGCPGALPLYTAFRARVEAVFPPPEIRTARTQISFYEGHMYACVSRLRPRRKAEMPAGEWITVTFSLPDPPASPRLTAARVSDQRWTCHAVIARPEDLDEELLGWLGISRALARSGRRPKNEKTVSPRKNGD